MNYDVVLTALREVLDNTKPEKLKRNCELLDSVLTELEVTAEFAIKMINKYQQKISIQQPETNVSKTEKV